MEKYTKIALSVCLIACFAAIGAGSASAFSRVEPSINPKPKTDFRIVPPEMRREFRQEFKEKWQEMTPEEKKELAQEIREKRQENRQEKIAAIEEFTGLTKEELKDAHKEGKTIGEIVKEQGKTKEEAEIFLTEQANKRVDIIVENHNLTEEQEQTLRARIAEFVQRILERWFGSN